MTNTVVLDEVLGKQRAEGPGGTRDEHRAVGVERARRLGGWCCMGEPRDHELSITQGELRFTRPEQAPDIDVTLVDVDEYDGAIGVLGLGGAGQAPERSTDQVEYILVAASGDGATGDDHQPSGGETIVGQVVLEDLEQLDRGFERGDVSRTDARNEQQLGRAVDRVEAGRHRGTRTG